MRATVNRLRRAAYMRKAARRVGASKLASFGADSVVVPPATILCPHRVSIGAKVIVFERSTFSLFEEHGGRRYSPRLTIGDRTVIGPGVWLSCVGEIELGSDVLLGPNVFVADSFHEYEALDTPIVGQPMAEPASVRIADGAMIGPGAAILSGVTVGEGSYVAPNAVVADDVPPRTVAAGNPAEVAREWLESPGSWRSRPDPRWAGFLETVTRP